MSASIVVLAGGTGGAKLARGMLDVAGEDLVVIANTGDDVEIHGGHVSPDPDLVTFWLADRVDERGWGLDGDTFHVMEALRSLGEDVWFNLGDQDLAFCLARGRRLADGATLTAAADDLRRALGVAARVLPMSDEPVRTMVKARGAWSGLQEWLIREQAAEPVEDVEFRGVAAAEPTAQVLEALAAARAVIVGPSNPVISIGPILAIRGLREALRDCPGPVIAISPLVGGRSLKGPTEAFLAWAGQPLSSDGIAAYYDGLLDGLVADERTEALPTLETDVAMADAAGRRRVAQEALDFALALG
jgi:LPPG:FO 2-phospho-L-lactate transferase